MDNILLGTILIIFFTALLSRIMQKYDRVLKSLRNFHITIVKKDGKFMWGRVVMYTNGLKLLFSKPFQSSGGSWVDSYIFYQTELENIKLIYRYHDELSPENQKRRLKEINTVAKPGYMRKGLRKLRNFISNFQEAFSETLGVFLNRIKTNAGDMIKSSEKHLHLAGSTALGAVGKDYDQILECHINKKVVIAVEDAKTKEEYSGYLGEYSAKWIALLDCRLDKDWELPLNDMNRMILNRDIDMTFCVQRENDDFGLEIEIKNYSPNAIRLKRIKGGEFSKNIYKTIEAEESCKIMLDKLPAKLFPEACQHIIDKKICSTAPMRDGDYHPATWCELKGKLPELQLVYQCCRHVDVYVNRSTAALKHVVSTVE